MGHHIKDKKPYWIGIPEEAYQLAGIPISRDKTEVAYFRHTFQLSQAGELTLRISANSRYRLWVNGQSVASGPLKGDNRQHYFDEIDITDYLKTGLNVLAVKVVSYPAYESKLNGNYAPLSIMSNGAGPYLMVEGSIKSLRGRVLTDLTTGHSKWWVCMDKAVGWAFYPSTFWMGAMERVDGAMLPYGWQTLPDPLNGFVEATARWLAYGDPTNKDFGLVPPLNLLKRSIPLLYETPGTFLREMPHKSTDGTALSFSAPQMPVVIEKNARYTVELDAGELITGYFILRTKEGLGSTIRIRYAESYFQRNGDILSKGVRDDASGEIIGHEDHYLPSGRDEVYEPFWFRTFRFIRLEVDTGDAALVLFPPEYLETGYPLNVLSHIDSTLPWIGPVWEISLRTLKRCMHETYEDCPYYEQLQYTMDTRLQILFTYMVSGDTRLALRAIVDYHRSMLPEGILQSRYPSREPQIIPGFSIFFILMVEDYYWQTGDMEAIRPFRPTIDAVLEWFRRKIGSIGLVENMGYWEFADWVAEWDRGVPRAVEKGPSTIHNLLYAYGLQSAARLNEITGRKGIATEYEKRANDILYQVDIRCWCDKSGLYTEGPDFIEYSQHAQVWAVLTGMARGKKAKSILKKALALEDISRCSYVMKFYLFRALETAGLYDHTEELWQDWQDMLKLNLTTCPEDFVGIRSDCHGWSALPLYEFTCKILGVQPLSPGWEKILIQPQCLSFPEFSGSVITPKGIVTLSWKNECGKFSIQGRVPDGVPFELCLPDGTGQLYLHGGSFDF